ncbi:hypothetical protein CPC08DRAFT_706745 [Agrocybe pediades]|nr:hypothetical protein CPC08DRAFT_706745 [Agrocybe pediades]
MGTRKRANYDSRKELRAQLGEAHPRSFLHPQRNWTRNDVEAMMCFHFAGGCRNRTTSESKVIAPSTSTSTSIFFLRNIVFLVYTALQLQFRFTPMFNGKPFSGKSAAGGGRDGRDRLNLPGFWS